MPSGVRNLPESEVPQIRLRRTTPDDLPALFEMQCDPVSNEMAGTKPRSREVFFAAWEGHFANPTINSRVIEIKATENGIAANEIAGSISCFQADGRDCVGYWIAKAHWGKRFASRALELFLKEEPRRPLFATTASTNTASRRILEKCGFRLTGFRMGEETERYVAREIAEFELA
ncbi:MAG: GNAT family N-acetyltransferase [Phycisphaeraceae bacterium]|nr:GNAT family N-acetyltransferase [Phycisphaeraceae bacterium]